MYELNKIGVLNDLMGYGVRVKTAFCGPCFGASDAPGNNDFCIRHSTRNFPNREGSNPATGQIASVALMDSKSIAATAFNGGYLTSAENCPVVFETPSYEFNEHIYENIVYNGFGKAKPETEIVYGPSIKDWPEMEPLKENLLLQVSSVIRDEVTTTDELIPSGETASYRSNPYKISEFTLIRKDPKYVGRAKAAQEYEKARLAGDSAKAGEFYQVLQAAGITTPVEELMQTTGIGSVLYANVRVMVLPASTRQVARRCSAVWLISVSSTQPSVTAATALTGASCRLHAMRRRSIWRLASMYTCRASARQSRTVQRNLRQPSSERTAAAGSLSWISRM